MLRVEWPLGAVQELRDLSAGQFLTVAEPRRLESQATGQLELHGWKGQAFRIETSANLREWHPSLTMTNQAGVLQASDPNISESPQRFYRAASK